MADLVTFRERVRTARRTAGRTQQQLAREIGLHPHVLSHKLNGAPGAVLNSREAMGIVVTLAAWGGIASRRDAEDLLRLASVPPLVVAQAWERPPLSELGPAPSADSPAVSPWWTGEHVSTLRPAPVPEPITPLVGREAELRTVLDLLRESRLVSLLGAGGTGKTRLALRAAQLSADRFPDGVAFVDLAPLADPELIAAAMLRSLGIAANPVEGTEDQLKRALRPRRMLMVVDNLEHLTAGASLLSRLLAAAPGLVLLATSRVVLRLYGEQQFRVRPLPLPDDSMAATAESISASDAVELFKQRARAVRSDFEPIGAELIAVAEICRVLGGLPLAIELAAAQIRTFSASDILERLDGRTQQLGGGPRDRPHRQQSLTAALAWSEGLLTAEQRRLLAYLGVFAGSFDAAAAAAVTGLPVEHVLALLIELDEQSLLEPSDRAIVAAPRFRLLEPVREYALTRLGEFVDVDDVRRAHLSYFCRTAQLMGPPRPGADSDPDLYRLYLDQANIRAALDWAVSRAADDDDCLLDALRLVTASGRMWSRRSLMAEGMAYLQHLLAIEADTRAAPPELRMVALLQAASFGCMRNDLDQTHQLAGAALALAGELDDAKVASKAHRLLGEAALAAGSIDEAMAHFDRQLELGRRAGDSALTGDALNMMGQGYARMGRLAEARTTLLAALPEMESAGDLDLVGAVIGSLADVAFRAGDVDEAAECWVAMLQIHREARTYRGMAYGLEGCATVEARRGRARKALEFASAAQRVRDAGGWILPEPEQRMLLAALAQPVGLLGEAERRQAISDGRRRDLEEIVDEAVAIDRPDALLRELGMVAGRQ